MAKANKPNMAKVMAVMGTVLMLARASELHAGCRVALLVDRTWPSIMRGHFCLYTEKKTGKPVGFCNWARVSQEVLDELLDQKREIKADDWDTGEIPFFPEMITPFGHLRKVIADLRDHAMAGVPWAYSLRGVMKNKDGTIPEQKVFKWKGRVFGADAPDGPGDKPVSPIRVI